MEHECAFADPRIRGTRSPDCNGKAIAYVPQYFIGPGPSGDSALYLCAAHSAYHSHLGPISLPKTRKVKR